MLTANSFKSAKREIYRILNEVLGFDLLNEFEIYETKNHICFEIKAVKFEPSANPISNTYLFRIEKSDPAHLEYFEYAGFCGNCIN